MGWINPAQLGRWWLTSQKAALQSPCIAQIEQEAAGCPCIRENQKLPRLYQQECSQQAQRNNLSPLFGASKALCGFLWALSTRKTLTNCSDSNRDLPRWSAHNRSQPLLVCLFLFGLEKTKMRGRKQKKVLLPSRTAYQGMQRRHSQTELSIERTIVKGHVLQQFRWYEVFSPTLRRYSNTESESQRICRISTLRGISTQVCKDMSNLMQLINNNYNLLIFSST